MANWQYKLNLGDFYHKYPEEISLQELSSKMSEALEALLVEIRQEPENVNPFDSHNFYREQILELANDLEDEIIPQFWGLADNDDGEEDDFNYALEDLYDWADTKLDSRFNGAAMCWVETHRNRS